MIAKLLYLLPITAVVLVNGQPSFTYADKVRVERSLPQLRETEEALQAAYVRRADAQDLIEHNAANVAFMEEQLQALQTRLATKQQDLERVDAEASRAQQTVQLGEDVQLGLCIRYATLVRVRVRCTVRGQMSSWASASGMRHRLGLGLDVQLGGRCTVGYRMGLELRLDVQM